MKKALLPQVVFQDGSHRKAKDGESKLAMSERMDGVERVVGGRVARVQPMAPAYEPVGGMIRVVIVKEEHAWFPFFSTDPNTTVVEIIEAFADRATIAQDFHDLKAVWGGGEQQVRNIWTNVAVYHLHLWMHALVELWAWNRPHPELCDRSDSPWDDPHRRPSHADRRKALRRHIMQNELSAVTAVWSLPRKILGLAQRLMVLAA